MKESKSSSSSKKRKRVSPDTSEPVRTRERSRSPVKKRARVEKALPRKTRWHAEITPERDASSKKVLPVKAVEKKENSGSDPPSQIKDLLDDKERLIEHLFATFTGAALQELIPDYLKKRTNEELKTLCLEQLKQMSSGLILHIISGKDPSLYVTPEKQDLDSKSESSAKSYKTEQKTDQKSKRKEPAVPKIDASENSSSDVLELFATSKEMEGIIEDENKVPLVVEEEVARELRLPESDAELLELEMRARAIRSLLKARSHALSGLDSSEPKEKKKKN